MLSAATEGLFSFSKIQIFFVQYSLHQILWHMYGVLNVDEKKLIAPLSEKSRDETFKPN